MKFFPLLIAPIVLVLMTACGTGVKLQSLDAPTNNAPDTVALSPAALAITAPQGTEQLNRMIAGNARSLIGTFTYTAPADQTVYLSVHQWEMQRCAGGVDTTFVWRIAGAGGDHDETNDDADVTTPMAIDAKQGQAGQLVVAQTTTTGRCELLGLEFTARL
jgi:hypothetical protein